MSERLRGEAAFTVHRFPAEVGRFYYSTQGVVEVGRDSVTVVQPVGCDSELGAGVEDNEVSVAAGFERSCFVADSGKGCRCAAHPANDVVERKTAMEALGVDDRDS